MLYSSQLSLDERLTYTNHRPSGFDYLRHFLAFGVILQHTVLLTGSVWIYDTITWSVLEVPAMLVVPMFFAISGFLIASSLERSPTVSYFIGLRALRIMPALSVEVFISALILGPILSTLHLSDYLHSGIFHRYFLNVFGYTEYYLPGVFENNPNKLVNGQLWTVPFEIIFYLALAVLASIGVYKNGKLLLAAAVACYFLQVINTVFRPNIEYRGPTGTTALIAFICAVVIYKYRAKIAWSIWIALACAIVAIISVKIQNGLRFSGLPIAYLTIYLGLLNPRKLFLVSTGDYSYGIYLYGYPIQQAVVAALPSLWTWYWNLLIAGPITIIVAIASWWIVERPFLRQGRQFLDRAIKTAVPRE